MKKQIESTDHAIEVKNGQRFEFGSNWSKFLVNLDDQRVKLAEQSIVRMLGVGDLSGKRFLDIGSGSGLFSLAARRLGASVHSFDYDPRSVACTEEVKRLYYPSDRSWIIEQGSVLNKDYLLELGRWDIVYSWGVLHHTGAMYEALNNSCELVCDGGLIFISIYNYQQIMTPFWSFLKRFYNRSPKALRWLILLPSLVILWGPRTFYDLFRFKPFYTWRNYAQHSMRGMSPWRDVVDWVGGYPFEVAKPEEIFHFFHDKGFTLKNLVTCGGKLGCNEFVFQKNINKSRRGA